MATPRSPPPCEVPTAYSGHRSTQGCPTPAESGSGMLEAYPEPSVLYSVTHDVADTFSKSSSFQGPTPQLDCTTLNSLSNGIRENGTDSDTFCTSLNEASSCSVSALRASHSDAFASATFPDESRDAAKGTALSVETESLDPGTPCSQRALATERTLA